jgi:hypothetical protein
LAKYGRLTVSKIDEMLIFRNDLKFLSLAAPEPSAILFDIDNAALLS